jgi:IS5 family transposase
MNRFCSYLWVVEQAHADKTRSAFDKYAAITHANSNRTKPIQQAVCDRGYVGVKEVLGATIILPKKA